MLMLAARSWEKSGSGLDEVGGVMRFAFCEPDETVLTSEGANGLAARGRA